MIPAAAYKAQWLKVRTEIFRRHNGFTRAEFLANRLRHTFEFKDLGFVAAIWHEMIGAALVLVIEVKVYSGDVTKARFADALDALSVTLSQSFGAEIASEMVNGFTRVGKYHALPEAAASFKRRRPERRPARKTTQGLGDRRTRH